MGYKKQIWWKDDVSLRLKFPVTTNHQVEVENAQLRFFAAPMPVGPTSVKVQVNQILGARRKSFSRNELFTYQNIRRNGAKWTLPVQCDRDCENRFNLYQAAVTSLIYPDIRRVKRSSPYQNERRTDCQKGKRKRKCCRQNMKLGPLGILLINKDDPSKLLLEKWDNMIVIECACS
ncbi:hypothetical protein NQ317_007113 [Molorchus minor]|uniref:TGF-beta family profile domain-containing protein n=1 Tax=Molorchus minor TaxID=1323400 RepID=A0ABQ9JXI4_9CUCU|nr:hypothetical protein NQ317_007113 [Molorchus minor]